MFLYPLIVIFFEVTKQKENVSNRFNRNPVAIYRKSFVAAREKAKT
jgi:hypothetical protein